MPSMSNRARQTIGPITTKQVSVAQYTFAIRVTVEARNEAEAFAAVNYHYNNPSIIGLTYVHADDAEPVDDQADGFHG